ncbi:MAG: peptidylprolyl isomerase [Bdellovibrionota bacterium]|nr:peptidylprolyl isomerase [Bdellovibrionota bacterium]
MKIDENTLVSIAYQIKDKDGNVIDEHPRDEPLKFVFGYSFVLAKIEEAILGLEAQDEIQVVLAKEDAYGDYRDELVTKVEKSHFANEFSIMVGMRFATKGPDGNDMVVEVIDINDNDVTLDGNHPLAGQDLIFDIVVLDVQIADAEEVAKAKKISAKSVIH